MTVVSNHVVPSVSWAMEFHALPLGAPIGLVVCLTIACLPVGILHHLLSGKVWVAPWGWLPIGVMLLLNVAIPLWIARYLWEEIRAAIRPTNWQVRLAPDALYVNLRSWRNWRLDEGTARAVRIAYGDIASLQCVKEEWRVLPRPNNVQRRFKDYVVIELAAGVDTSPMLQAVRAEVAGILNHKEFPSGAGIWNDMPAFAGGDGTIRIRRPEMSLLRALRRQLPNVKHRPMRLATHTVGQEFAFQPAEVTHDDLVAFVLRSEWQWAQMTAQFRGGLSYDASVALIKSLFTGQRR